MILTFVIPVYNSEPYIKRCLESIYSQGISEGEFEVICIDDCSKDKSFSIINDFNKKHTNLTLIHFATNKKQGAARNYGLRIAKGNYIWFVDSDDYIKEEILKEFLQIVSNSNSDIIQFNALTISERNTIISDRFLDTPINNITGIDYLKYEMNINYSNRIQAVWSKLHKREFLLKNDIFFEEGIYWEDVLFTLKSIYLTTSFQYIPIIAYNYVETPNSDLRGKINARKYVDTIRFCIESLNFLDKNDFDYDLRQFISKRYISTIIKYEDKIKKLSFLEYTKYINLIKKIDLTILQQYLKTNEYFWLLSIRESFHIWSRKSITIR